MLFRTAISGEALLLVCVLSFHLSYAQQLEHDASRPGYAADPANVADARQKVESGHFAPVHVEMLARSGDRSAIPVMETQFANATDPLMKDKLASALVRLGDTNPSYWTYVLQAAQDAVDSNLPAGLDPGHAGPTSSEATTALTQWANSQHLSVTIAAENIFYLYPAKVLYLAQTDDPRGIPVLRKALLSNDFAIQINGAKGLAALHDENSVPALIAACNKASVDVAKELAESLVFFNDKAAAAEAAKFLTANQIQTLRVRKESGLGPLGS